MSGDKGRIYWDTNIFIAWLKDEQRKPGEMDGVREYVEKAMKGEIVLVTSVMTKIEVLRCKMPARAEELFAKLLKRRNVRAQPLDIRVADIANQIRDYYQRQSVVDGLPTVSTPDATHLATAILYEVDEFHTFDEKDKPDSRGLIPLSGNVAGYNLIICKPESKQLGLDLKKS